MPMTPEELKIWRRQNRVTQLELADLLRTTRTTVGRWEIGTHPIPSFLFLALAELSRRLAENSKGAKPLKRMEVRLQNGSKNPRKKAR
jgi:transcriptional regulator with XRE-family HTH domain